MRFAFEPPARAVARIKETDAVFPVRRIYCIGRNYAEHAVEMGHDPSRETPFFFLKPADALDQSGEFPYPPGTQDVHHEVELTVFLKSGGRDISTSDALSHVFGYAVGLDMTRRDLQQEAKKSGRPWEIGKGFDRSAPCSEIVAAGVTGHPARGAITLAVNGTPVQRGDLNQQIWKVPEIIAYLSSLFELAAGDVIMTGTPAGVGSVSAGDKLDAEIEGVGRLSIIVI